MGADYVVHYSCRPKQTLGAGDDRRGTRRLIDLLKVETLAAQMETLARKEGKKPEEVDLHRMTRNVATGKTTKEKVVYLDLLAQLEPLRPLEEDCQRCPVNAFRDSLGCCGFLRYPIAAAAERWLLDRVQPADQAGGFYFLKAIGDLGYTGELMKQWRAGGLFEADAPSERVLDPERPDETRVTSDQIWHALFGVGNELQPWHCAMILLWLGSIRHDGEVPAGPEDLRALLALAPADRRAHTRPDFGPRSPDAAVLGVQQLLYACYLSWLHEVPLLMDA
jgi:hypothetical protein